MRQLRAAFLLLICPATFVAGTFEANRGQTDARVQYLARYASGQIFFTRDAAVEFHFAGYGPGQGA